MTDKAQANDKAPENNRILVYLRIRPPNSEEREWVATEQYPPLLRDRTKTMCPEKQIIIDASDKPYNFDKVFWDDVTSETVFREAALPTILNAFEGYCGAVMAYGQTGTGKTHTIQGWNGEKGVIPRTAEYIFSRIQRDSVHTNFEVTISFVQIYLDKLMDLFAPDAPEISINPETERVELPGINVKTVNDAERLMKLYYQGETHRVTRATKMNPTSSRGHAALIINIKSTPKDDDGTKGTKIGKIVIVDLAGYERFTQTGIEGGIAVEEAKKINASLLSLGSVVNALAAAAEKKSGSANEHIPYRNAKLTRLLKDCLGGTSKTSIICTMGPSAKYKQETTGTLYFGFRAMAVKVDARAKAVFDPAKYLATLKEMLANSQKTLSAMASWWSQSHAASYKQFCESYDMSAIQLQSEEDIIRAMEEQSQKRQSIIPHVNSNGAKASGSNNASNSQRASVSSQDVGRDGGRKTGEEQILTEVQNVSKKFNEEINHFELQAQREEEQLMTRHMQEIEELKSRGAKAETLQRLVREQQEEIELQRRELNEARDNLLLAKEKEEIQALFTAAKTSYSRERGGTTREEGDRIEYITSFLHSTCCSKDEVVANLLNQVVHHEAEIGRRERAEAEMVKQLARIDGPTEDEVIALKFRCTDLEEEVQRLRNLMKSQQEASPPQQYSANRNQYQNPQAFNDYPPQQIFQPPTGRPSAGTAPAQQPVVFRSSGQGQVRK